MSLGISISSGKTGMAGTNAGWRIVKEQFEWDCECGRHVEKHWAKCPDCSARPPERAKK